MPEPEASPALLVGRVVVGGVRLAGRLVPRRLRQAITDRVFYGIFNTTRVMNDNYGWRPGEEASYTTRGPAPRKKTP